jgi:hypothetical protein
VDIGTLTGAISIEDQFSSVMEFAARKVEDFAETFGESAVAVVGGAGIIVGAIAGIAVGISALASKGADVNDVSATLDHFAESAGGAEAVMDGLRSGVKGTVADMDLMKDASRVLSAGAKLNADDLRTMGEAAFVLQNRGLGGTAEMLGMISDAMVTGRTRTLAMKLGVVDAADAEQDYANKLGIAKSELTQTQSAEARRAAVLGMLRGAVKDAGDQQLDFGEKLEKVEASMANWMERLESTVAESPAVTRAIDAITGGIDRMGGGEAIMDAVVQGIEAFADVVSFAEPYVESLASGVKSLIGFLDGSVASLHSVSDFMMELGLRAQGYSKAEAEAMVAADNSARAQRDAAKASGEHAEASKALTEEQKAEKASTEAAAASHRAYEQTVQGVIDSVRKANRDAGAFAEAFDKMSLAQRGTADAQAILIPQLDKMIAQGDTLTASQKNYYAMVVVGQENLRREGEEKLRANGVTADMIEKNLALGMSEAALAAKLGVTVEALKAYQGAATQLRDVKADINRLELEWSGHLADQVEADRAREKAAIAASFTGTKEQLAELLAAVDEKYDLIKKTGSDAWRSVENSSISAKLQQIRDAEEVLAHMEASGNFQREEIEKQRLKVQQLRDEFRGLGDEAAATGPKLETCFDSLGSAMLAADQGIDATTIKVKMLDGSVLSLAEAIKKFNQGNTYQYDLTTKKGVENYRQLNTAMNVQWSDEDIMAFAKAGGTLEQLINRGVISYKNGLTGGLATANPGDMGPNVGPAGGGGGGPRTTTTATPAGSTTVTTSAAATVTTTPMGGMKDFGASMITNHFQVNGTAEETAKKIGGILMDQLKMRRFLPTAG